MQKLKKKKKKKEEEGKKKETSWKRNSLMPEWLLFTAQWVLSGGGPVHWGQMQDIFFCAPIRLKQIARDQFQKSYSLYNWQFTGSSFKTHT